MQRIAVSIVTLMLAIQSLSAQAQFRRDVALHWDAVQAKAEVGASGTGCASAGWSAADSLPAGLKLKLLPENMTIFESVFWGERGLFRGMSPLTLENRKKELEVRRTMLSVHQLLGFTTLALMTASVVAGQVLLNDYDALRFEEAQRMRQTHRTLSIVTFGTYMATAAMPTFAPPPLIRRDEWSTVTTHKLFAALHLTGMVAQPILAMLAANASNLEQVRALRRVHQVVGYITLVALAAAMMVITF